MHAVVTNTPQAAEDVPADAQVVRPFRRFEQSGIIQMLTRRAVTRAGADRCVMAKTHGVIIRQKWSAS